MVGAELLSAAKRSRPFTSAGLPGKTTCKPGVLAYHGCGLPECWAAPAPRMPYSMWNTTGAVTVPPEFEYTIAASLTICGIASYEKVAVLSSTIGRAPASAAPTPMPQYASSAIGGGFIRGGWLFL